jgi:hypothetical protein
VEDSPSRKACLRPAVSERQEESVSRFALLAQDAIPLHSRRFRKPFGHNSNRLYEGSRAEWSELRRASGAFRSPYPPITSHGKTTGETIRICAIVLLEAFSATILRRRPCGAVYGATMDR